MEKKGEYIMGSVALKTVKVFLFEVEDLWIYSRDEVTDVRESDFSGSVVIHSTYYLIEKLRTRA